MQDSDMVTAIAAEDPEGLAAAYDRYAAGLYAYCRAMLTEPAGADQAVADTFVIAATRLTGLSDPERLRVWLYAVARNECHRRLRARAATADSAGPDEATSVEVDPEQAGPPELVSAALAGLSPLDREIVELNLRQELHGDDLAAVLGVPRHLANLLAARARGRFETLLGVLLVARSGRASCATLDELLGYWDGRLDPLLRRRAARHIQRCDACGQRRRRELHLEALLALLPEAVLPDTLRDEVLGLVSSTTPAGIARRELTITRAGSFEAGSGFPVALDPPPPPPTDRRRHYAVAAVAAVALLCGFLIELGVRHPHKPAVSRIALGSNTLGPAAAGTSSSAAPASSRSTGSTASRTHGTVVPSSLALAPAGSTTPPIVIVPGSGQPTSPAPRPTGSHQPSPPPSSPSATLSASSSVVGLGPDPGGSSASGSFTLTANGGTISFSIVVPPGLSGLTLSQYSDTLTAGSSVTIDVTWNSSSPVDAGLSINPGGLTVTVEYPAPPG